MLPKNMIIFIHIKPNRVMKKLLKKIEKWYDIYIVYFLYNGNKQNRYYDYLRKKYGKDL